MREILYRAKGIDAKDRNRWYEGGYWCMEEITLSALYHSEEQWRRDKEKNEHHLILVNGFSDWNLPKPHYKVAVNPETLCQFIGCLDANKEYIWENDIVRVTNTYNGLNTESWYIVAWRDDAAAFVFTDLLGQIYNHINGFSEYCIIEVMGNRFDDPELLDKIECETLEEFKANLEKEFRRYAN